MQRRRPVRANLRGAGGGAAPSVERLEARTLLAAAPVAPKAVVARAAAPKLLASKVVATTKAATVKPALLAAAAPSQVRKPKAALLARAGTALSALSSEFTSFRAANPTAKFQSRSALPAASGETVAIEAFAKPGQGATLQAQLKSLGMTGVRRFGHVVSGRLPIKSVAKLTSTGALRAARPAWAYTHAGSTQTQADFAVRANVARAVAGVTGAGVKVGILSDSFDTSATASTDYADDVASGDLPAGVQVLMDHPGGSDEGRAMAQLVHDTAPGAQILFATGFGGETVMANNIRALAAAGADVIVDDIGYPFEPMFQDGVLAQAVDEVAAQGVAYFSSAGNAGRDAYESPFRVAQVRDEPIARASGAPSFGGGVSHDFDPGPGVDDLQAFTLGPGEVIQVLFQWDQPYRSASPGGNGPGSASDLDIYLLNAAGTLVVAGSADDNIGALGDPSEGFAFQNTGTTAQAYNLMVVNWGVDPAEPEGPNPGLMKYVYTRGGSGFEYATHSGTTFGHPTAAGAAGVGTAWWFQTPAAGVSPPVVADYSSAGTTPTLFNAAGQRLATPEVRQQPRFVASDGGNTTFFGQALDDGDDFPNFFGTSAAAPTAAAVAALMLDRHPSLTPAEIYQAMQDTALDMDDPATGTFDAGYDPATGYGLIRADAALAAVAPRVTGVVVDDGGAQRSRVKTLTVTFNRRVTAAAGAFDLKARATGAAVAITATNPSNDGRTYVLTVGGAGTTFGSLDDGVYDLIVRRSSVADVDGNAPAADHGLEFHRLFSDADGDGDSDAADLSVFRQSLGKSAGDPAYRRFLDYDDSDAVDALDLNQTRGRRSVTYIDY